MATDFIVFLYNGLHYMNISTNIFIQNSNMRKIDLYENN